MTIKGYSQTRRYEPEAIMSFCLLVLFSTFSQAQQASNIYLGELNFLNNAEIKSLHAITTHDSYTNQPYFINEHELYYTQSVTTDDREQMDSFVYNLFSKTSTNLTNSKQSEYSPTPLPSRKGFSVIRVGESGKQELWSYSKEGKAKEHLVPVIEPVGYQVWINKHELLLFVLGEPHTLQRVDKSKPQMEGEVIDDHIGASLYRFQQSDWFLFSKKTDEDKLPMLKAYNTRSKKVIGVGNLIEGSEYFSVSTTGHLLASDTQQLHHRRLTISGGKPTFKGIWNKVVVDSEECTNGISRTAISDFGDKIALVCNRQ